MPFAFDFRDGDVIEWTCQEAGAEPTVVTEYRPTTYVAGPDKALAGLRAALRRDPKITAMNIEHHFTSLRDRERERVLRIDLERMSDVHSFAREVRGVHEQGDLAPGTLRLFNVDLDPGFRYCIETGTDPTPEGELETLQICIGEKHLADERVTRLAIDDEIVEGQPDDVLETVAASLREVDPDVLHLSHGDLVPLLEERAVDRGLGDFALGRRDGWTRLAGENTFESYGQVGHSPARYSVPGRAIVDDSASFLLDKSGIAGILALVEVSKRPLQEAARASIGTVLTSMEIRTAMDRDVLAPWNKWRPEAFKDVTTLHDADRGGFTFDAHVGLHEDVLEVDFSSLYPKIMCTYDVSPETVNCEHHPVREEVPEIGYTVCDRDGFLGEVLTPLLDRRDREKRRLADMDDPDEVNEAAEGVSDAIKWILVSCFGYQGYRNAKFGRIEAHEAINAYARDCMLTAKEYLEEAGWQIVHGIVDSLWITACEDVDPTPIEEVCARVTDDVQIALEFEGYYDWVAFVPRRERAGSALTKYVGKKREGGYKVRGVEARQRSTPPFVAAVQRDLFDVVDRHRTPDAVCGRLRRHLGVLRRGGVDPDDLLIRKRVSKRLEEYTQATHTVAALKRGRAHGLSYRPGQSVQYVVVADDASRTMGRVRLHFEEYTDYDAEYYADLLVRAATSVVSPFGWTERDVRDALREDQSVELSAFTD